MAFHERRGVRAALGAASVLCALGWSSSCGSVGGGGSSSSGGGSSIPAGFFLVAADPAGGTVLQDSAGTQRRISGTFQSDLFMDSSFDWVLDGPVFFGDNQASASPTLTIEAGTTVFGRGGTPPSMLVIRRGARIEAIGTQLNPIVFTSAQPVGQRAAGDWGGLVINGRAPVNDVGPGGELPLGEGGSGPYGGNDPDDDSGTLRFVRVEFAGHIFTSDDELNGIAFQGVGRGTEVEFIQVHRALDDGVEFFGGTVDAKNVYLTGCVDDSLDWTSGWSGRVQFVAVQQYTGGANNGIEADNLEGNNDASPRSAPVISNMTLVGPATPAAGGNVGLQLRRGTGARILNSIVLEMKIGLDIDDLATWNNAYADEPTFDTLSGALTLESCFFFGHDANFTTDGADPITEASFYADQANQIALDTDPQLGAPQDQLNPSFVPNAGSPVRTSFVNPNDTFFTTVLFSGAMDSDDWTTGWTTADPN